MATRLLNLIKRVLFPPCETARPAPHVWEELAAHCAALGMAAPCLFLSFDCDTDLDIPAAHTLGEKLSQRGIKATFAVPGAQLMRGASTFAAMAASGFEFMNHGCLPHAGWDGKKYYPETFYDQMPRDAVTADIREGDRIVREVTGVVPQGFRAPHFGCFQKPEQIDFMHRLCAELGYSYASTTVPALGLERGPAWLSHGVVELSLTGSWREPLNIPDSWSNLSDRVSYTLSERYYELFSESLEAVQTRHWPLLLCWYADPAHVINQPPFEKTVDLLARSGIRTLTGAECAGLCRSRLAPEKSIYLPEPGI